MIITSIFISISILYLFLIFIFIWGHIRTDIFSNDTISNSTQVSIIISVRNEEQNILNLIQDLKKQTYPKNLFEVIFVNDHSTDKTVNILQQNCNENFKFINLSDFVSGKKQALNKAINIAKGEIIVTTDGDCSMKDNWLTSIVSFYEINNSDMIIAPVIFNKKNNFLGIFQFYDFLALISSTIGACGINRPIMCNGANLIYKKQVYNELVNPTKNEISSGDDMFLMINLKKTNKKINFINSIDALVSTNSEKSFKNFINQRIRWTGKNTKHTDLDIYIVGILVYLFNLTIFSIGLLSIWNIQYFIYFFQIIFAKTFIEFIFISITSSVYKQKIRLITFFLIQPFHIIYSITIPILSIIFPYKWKGRKI